MRLPLYPLVSARSHRIMTFLSWKKFHDSNRESLRGWGSFSPNETSFWGSWVEKAGVGHGENSALLGSISQLEHKLLQDRLWVLCIWVSFAEFRTFERPTDISPKVTNSHFKLCMSGVSSLRFPHLEGTSSTWLLCFSIPFEFCRPYSKTSLVCLSISLPIPCYQSGPNLIFLTWINVINP